MKVDTPARTAFFDGVSHTAVTIGGVARAAAFYERVRSFNVTLTVGARWVARCCQEHLSSR